MARHEINFSELLDVDALKAECCAVMKTDRPLLELRSALLPIMPEGA